MKNAIWILIFLFTPFLLWAQETRLQGGPNFYEAFKESHPGWQFISVPKFYNSPSKETTWISYRISGSNLDPNKKTILFFNGGPGGNSLNYSLEQSLPEFNFIYFNQRGVGFSNPESPLGSQEISEYFSTENTTRDAKILVERLGLKKVIIYGHSYGTVPATVFASWYPDLTEMLLLEGIVFTGTDQLWTGPHRIKMIQKYFDQLPTETQDKIIYFSNIAGIDPAWFSKIGQQSMYGNSYKEIIQHQLNYLFEPLPAGNSGIAIEEAIITSLKFRFPSESNLPGEDNIYFSATTFKAISCLELSGYLSTSTFSAVFENRQLKVQPSKSDQCAGIDLTRKKTYLATDYPVTIPVVYFQGETDGATTADQAIHHFKEVPQGPAILMIRKDGGHASMLDILNPYVPIDNEYTQNHRELFKALVNKQNIDLTLINKDIPKKEQWVMIQRK